MMDCENCVTRKYYARAFDMHWLGKDDCPYECEETTERTEQKNEDQNV